MFGDLTTISQTNTMVSYIAAVVVVEFIILVLFRLTNSPLTGKEINEWYDTYGLDALLLDMLSATIGFVLAAFAYPLFFSEFNLGYFLLVILVIQIAHDYLFWRYVIVPIPKGHNKVIDTLKVYAEQAKGGAIIGDSVIYILAVPIASMLLYASQFYGMSFLLGVILFALYPVMYLLYTKPVKDFGR